jgi:hypothetical protein
VRATDLAVHGIHGPGAKRVAIFDDFRRHPVITLEDLFGIWPKRFHAMPAIGSDGGVVGFEVKPSAMNDAEKNLVSMEAEAAEHAPRLDALQLLQLIEDKILERLVRLIHAGAAKP